MKKIPVQWQEEGNGEVKVKIEGGGIMLPRNWLGNRESRTFLFFRHKKTPQSRVILTGHQIHR